MSGPAAPIGVVIADDHDLFREGLAELIGRDAEIRVLGQAATGDDAVRLVLAVRPEVLLLDVEMPGGGVRATLARLRRDAPGTRVVILTMHADAVLRRDLLAAGAAGYLGKTLTGAQVVDALHACVASPPGRAQDALPAGRAGILTAREESVLSLMARGLRNPAIAADLSIAVGTVRRHINAIYRKLGAGSRVDAIRRGYALGILTEATPRQPEGR